MFSIIGSSVQRSYTVVVIKNRGEDWKTLYINLVIIVVIGNDLVLVMFVVVVMLVNKW